MRDLLLGRHPKDFDVATNALPEEIRKLFKNSRIIGKRFRLVHIVFGKEIIEVATFRTHHENASDEQQGHSHEGMIIRDNVFGAIEDDAVRRDFTINALYYNIADFSVVDYLDSMNDIKNKMLRIIGKPEQRFLEDPIRLLRAIRFMGKLNLQVHTETEQALLQHYRLLEQVSSARIFQEILKFFKEGATFATFNLLQKYQVFELLFPETAALLNNPGTSKFICLALQNSDERIVQGKTVSPAFLLAVFLWKPILKQTKFYQEEGLSPYMAIEKAIENVFKRQLQKLEIPRKLLSLVREISLLQYRFTQRRSKRTLRLLEHPRFRAAYDLLLLREHAEENVKELCLWWTQFAAGTEEQRNKMLKEKGKKLKNKSTTRKENPKE